MPQMSFGPFCGGRAVVGVFSYRPSRTYARTQFDELSFVTNDPGTVGQSAPRLLREAVGTCHFGTQSGCIHSCVVWWRKFGQHVVEFADFQYKRSDVVEPSANRVVHDASPGANDDLIESGLSSGCYEHSQNRFGGHGHD